MEDVTRRRSPCDLALLLASVPLDKREHWLELYEYDPYFACRLFRSWRIQRDQAARRGGGSDTPSGYGSNDPNQNGLVPVSRGSPPGQGERKVPRWRDSVTPVILGHNEGGSPTPAYSSRRDGLLVSEPHYRLKNGAWSGGGNFYQFSYSRKHVTDPGGYYYKNGNWWDGPIGLVSPIPYSLIGATTPYLQSWGDVKAEASSHYASGYAKTRPGNPMASLGQFLAELRDLPSVPLVGSLRKRYRPLLRRNGVDSVERLPAALQRRHLKFRDLGSEYLNVVFGWEPFVRDLREMYNLWKDIDKRLAQIIRDNGRAIRRRASVARENDTSETRTTYGFPFGGTVAAPLNWTTGTRGSIRVVQTRWSMEAWYSGSYRYYIPDTGSSQWRRRATLALFGALPTPELLWELMPYSWLIDWFSNVGDVVSNMSMNAVDNLVTNYSFVMRRESWEQSASVITWHEKRDDFGGSPPSKSSSSLGSWWKAHRGSYSSTERWEIKSRVGGGNPFGLDVSLPSLSGRQLAILAALGISRQSVL